MSSGWKVLTNHVLHDNVKRPAPGLAQFLMHLKNTNENSTASRSSAMSISGEPAESKALGFLMKVCNASKLAGGKFLPWEYRDNDGLILPYSPRHVFVHDGILPPDSGPVEAEEVDAIMKSCYCEQDKGKGRLRFGRKTARAKPSHTYTRLGEPYRKVKVMTDIPCEDPPLHYLAPGLLPVLTKPYETLTTCVNKLQEGRDCNKECLETLRQANESFVKLVRSCLPTVLNGVTKAILSEDDITSCLAMVTLGELCQRHPISLKDRDVVRMFSILFAKLASTKRMVQLHVKETLLTLASKVEPDLLINVLVKNGVTHRNSAVRCTASKLLYDATARCGGDKVLQCYHLVRLIFFTVLKNLEDDQKEIRNAGRRMLAFLIHQKNGLKNLHLFCPGEKLDCVLAAMGENERCGVPMLPKTNFCLKPLKAVRVVRVS